MDDDVRYGIFISSLQVSVLLNTGNSSQDADNIPPLCRKGRELVQAKEAQGQIKHFLPLHVGNLQGKTSLMQQ
jgi:hypothetical protein